MIKRLAGTPALADELARVALPPDASARKRPRSDVPVKTTHRHTIPPATGPPTMAYTTYEAARISHICRSILYREIRAGRLIARKSGRSTIILDDDLRAFLASLPQMPAMKPAREAAAAVLDKTADAGREEGSS